MDSRSTLTNYEAKECEPLSYWLVSISIICNCIKVSFFMWRNKSYRRPLVNCKLKIPFRLLRFFNLICSYLNFFTEDIPRYCMLFFWRKMWNLNSPCKFKRFSKDKTDYWIISWWDSKCDLTEQSFVKPCSHMWFLEIGFFFCLKMKKNYCCNK